MFQLCYFCLSRNYKKDREKKIKIKFFFFKILEFFFFIQTLAWHFFLISNKIYYCYFISHANFDCVNCAHRFPYFLLVS